MKTLRRRRAPSPPRTPSEHGLDRALNRRRTSGNLGHLHRDAQVHKERDQAECWNASVAQKHQVIANRTGSPAHNMVAQTAQVLPSDAYVWSDSSCPLYRFVTPVMANNLIQWRRQLARGAEPFVHRLAFAVSHIQKVAVLWPKNQEEAK